MILLFSFKITGAWNSHIQTMTDIPTEAKTANTELLSYYSGVMDYGFLFLAIGVAIATLILAALVRIHPVFIPLYFIGLVFVIILSAAFSNIYQEMAGNSEMLAYADQLHYTSYILEYLPLFVGVVGIILMIVMYKTWSVVQE
jgi:hypothetical protein